MCTLLIQSHEPDPIKYTNYTGPGALSWLQGTMGCTASQGLAHYAYFHLLCYAAVLVLKTLIYYTQCHGKQVCAKSDCSIRVYLLVSIHKLHGECTIGVYIDL